MSSRYVVVVTAVKFATEKHRVSLQESAANGWNRVRGRSPECSSYPPQHITCEGPLLTLETLYLSTLLQVKCAKLVRTYLPSTGN
jgi:hypothetical protein